jgi:hypothetical protein
MSCAARAQEPGASGSLNYAFATQLGSGIYSVNGRTVQIYRITVSPQIRSPEESWGLRIRLPLTFGFYDFKLEDVVEKGLPDRLGTLAFVPTAEFEFRLRREWWLLPSAGMGLGKDFSGGEFNFIYALGVRSLAIFSFERSDLRLGNRLVYTGYTSDSLDFVDDFGMFETGIDWRRPLGFELGGHVVDGSLFAANYLYFVSPQLFRLAPEPIEMRTEWELGFTLGFTEAWKVLGVRMPRLGLSYRFGSGAEAIRFIIGDAFPIDSPSDRGPRVQ